MKNERQSHLLKYQKALNSVRIAIAIEMVGMVKAEQVKMNANMLAKLNHELARLNSDLV